MQVLTQLSKGTVHRGGAPAVQLQVYVNFSVVIVCGQLLPACY